MANYQVTEFADDDIFKIGFYLSARRMKGAERFAREIEQTFERLAEFPGIGRMRDELKPGIRSYVMGSYVIVYRVTDEGILVLRVFHGSQDYEREFE